MFRLTQTLSCLLPVPVSLLILASLLLSDCISTFIWYSQTALLCRAAFLIPRGGYTCRFLQREERIADSSPLLNSRPVLWATTPPPPLLVRTPLCHANCFVFFFDTLPLLKHPLWAKGSLKGEEKKRSFLSVSKFSLWNSLSPCGWGKCTGGFMTTGSKVWVFQPSSCNDHLSGYSWDTNWHNRVLFIMTASESYWSTCIYGLFGVCVSVLST